MILFHFKIKHELKNRRKIKSLIKNIIDEENKIMGDINYVFCTDNYLLEINSKYLNHNTLTDIITFNFCENKKISGDILISLDRIKENSSIFEQPFNKELYRVMIHGVLHLIGYKDKTSKEKERMRKKEDYYLVNFL